MCGRIVQKSGPLDYVERIFPNVHKIFSDPAGPRYNIPPGTRPLTMHRLAGEFELDRQWWTWRPSGSKYAMNCARLDKIVAGKWPWKMLTGHGRILVPADGWYEWKALTDEPKPPKQPYYIHAADNTPLFFAALSNWRAGAEKDEAHGFAIVTDDSAGGMVDVHDRRPVALPADLAIHWLDRTSLQPRLSSCSRTAFPKRPSPGTRSGARSAARSTSSPTPSSRRRLSSLDPVEQDDRGGQRRLHAVAGAIGAPQFVLPPMVHPHATDSPASRRPSSNRPSAPTGSRRPWSAPISEK